MSALQKANSTRQVYSRLTFNPHIQQPNHRTSQYYKSQSNPTSLVYNN